LLPKSVCEPAVALYAFCRAADDLIDADGGAASLPWLRERLDLIYDQRPLALPCDRAFAHVVKRFAIPRELPEALLEGFAWDAEGRRYADLSGVRDYSVRVAGTVGAMMAVLMGVRDARRLAAAVDLGVAMQLSNIARDVGEDARNGRIYLPLDWLAEMDIDAESFLRNPRYSPGLGRVIWRLLDTADSYYRRAEAGISELPIGCRFGIAAARLLYAEIGAEVRRRGFNSVSGRAVVSGRRKLWVLASGLTRLGLTIPAAASEPVPEGVFLVDAVVRATRPAHAAAATPPWWDLGERMVWTLELFGRLEQREQVQTERVIA
jgi:phytoene synthase